MKEGYQRLSPLSKEKCEKIVEALKLLPFKARTKPHIIVGLNYSDAQSNIYEVGDQSTIISIPEVRELSNDHKLLSIVRDYLGAEPIQTQASSWWSANVNKLEQAKAAQKFHQDRTYKKFVKLFLYLTDVTKENGCHVYVPYSMPNHFRLRKGGVQPPKNRLSERVSDEYIEKNYDEIVYLTGPMGTMNLVDTQGWHKGNVPRRGQYRLLIQLEWSSDAIYLATGKILKYI